jgi:hypothetical protein
MKRFVLVALVCVLGIGVLSAGAAEIESGGQALPEEAASLVAAGGVLGQPVEVQGTVIIPVTASLHGGVFPVGVLVVRDGQVSVLMEESGKRFADALAKGGKQGRQMKEGKECAMKAGSSGEGASGKKCAMKASGSDDASAKSCPMKSGGADGGAKRCAMMQSGKACPMKTAAASASAPSGGTPSGSETPESGEAAPAAEKPAAHAHH